MPLPYEAAGGRPRPRRPLWIAFGLGAVAVVALTGLLRFRSRPAPEAERALLEARAAVLDAQLAMAREEVRYLVLDPERGTLTFFHGGAPLRSWPVLEVEAGARRLGEEEKGWRTRRWDGARMEPPVERERRVIVSDSVAGEPDLTAAEEWIPPLPEEAVPTPDRFVVHYEGGLGLEVLSVEGDSARVEQGVMAATEHRLRRLLPRNWDRYRIRVRMDAAEAGRLYRALPDSTSFLAILPGG